MPKIVDHDERRAHIAEAVTNIIIRDGIERVTMREIAAEAGYAHGAIARYFPNKQSLLTEAFLRVFEDSNERVIERASHVRGLDALDRMCREILPFDDIGSTRSRIVLSFWDRAAQDEELWQIHHDNIMKRRALIQRFLLEAQEDGELDDSVNIEVAVEEVSARNAGWQMLAVLVPEATSDAVLNAGLRSLINSFRATPRED